MKDRRTLGEAGERAAAEFLERLGYRILERNVRSRLGEIDLIAEDGETTVFVEVKTLRSTPGFSPMDHFDRRKQRKLLQLAQAYLSKYRSLPAVRFDLVAVTETGGRLDIDHLKDVLEDSAR